MLISRVEWQVHEVTNVNENGVENMTTYPNTLQKNIS